MRQFFSQANITCLLGKGKDKVDILYRKDFAGGLVSDIEESLRFIERNTRTDYRRIELQGQATVIRYRWLGTIQNNCPSPEVLFQWQRAKGTDKVLENYRQTEISNQDHKV